MTQGDGKTYIVSAEAVNALLRAHDGDCALLWLWSVSTGSTDAERAALDLCMTAGQVKAAQEKLQRMVTAAQAGVERTTAQTGVERTAAQAGTGTPAAGQPAMTGAPGTPAFAAGTPGAFAAGSGGTEPDAAGTGFFTPGTTAGNAPAVVQVSPPDAENAASGQTGAVRRPVAPADELPEYTAEEITSCAHSDNGFHAVLQEAEQILGKQLSRHDMSRLLGIYNHLGLPADVIFILLHFCEESSRGPEGAERRPTMNFIEHQAYAWVRHGIDTAEAAESFAEREKTVRADLARIRRVLEIYDRNLTGNERASIESWIAAGLSDEVIRKAYELTLENTGKRSMAYMNKILLTWAEAGVKTVSDISTKAGRKNTYTQKTGSRTSGSEHGLKPTEF